MVETPAAEGAVGHFEPEADVLSPRRAGEGARYDPQKVIARGKSAYGACRPEIGREVRSGVLKNAAELTEVLINIFYV